MQADEAIEWLYGTQLFGIKLGLEGPRRLLREFLAVPKSGVKVVQLVGTNGKGSTAALMDSVARASGVKTGLFTSPHLVHFSERIRVNGVRISEAAIARGLSELRALVEGWEHHPTFFELTLALAMRHFAGQDCELIVMETGMGGRLDATTAVPADIVTISPIGMDHQRWLGDTLAKIAAEKAGAIRDEKPVISVPQEADAARVIEVTANERRAPLTWIDQPLLGYGIGLAGEHQRWNAALALQALHALGISLREEAVRLGLAGVSWPGRFERLEGGRVIIDGAHNPQAAEVLAKTWQQQVRQPATLVFGAVESKEVDAVLRHLAPLARRVLLVRVPTQRGLAPELLSAAWPDCSELRPELVEDFNEALDSAMDDVAPVLIAGSLFLIGAVRARLAGVPFQASSQ